MGSVLPFVHIDLAPPAPQQADFTDVALQPGRAVLDDKNANCYALMQWLGPLVAEPERHGGRIDFYVRDERNARVPNISCTVVTEADLDGELKKDLTEIEAKLKAATPRTSIEKAVQEYAAGEMAALKSELRKKERRFYFMKWQDDKKKWHLVWCAGFRRRDSQPAVPVICTSKCRLYFLNRTSAAPKCPKCNRHTDSGGRSGGLGLSIVKAIAALCVLCAVAGGVWWFAKNQNGGGTVSPVMQSLIVSPETWTGPVGSQVEFTVKRRGQNGQADEDVTATARPLVDEDRILAFSNPFRLLGRAKSPGKTKITFVVGEMTRQIDVTVEPPANPLELVLVPARLEVAVDAQVPWKLQGRFENGRTADLTTSAELSPHANDPFGVDVGLVRGLEAGEGKLVVRYRATDESKYMSAEVPVVVTEKPFKSLELAVSPANLRVGQLGEVSVTAVADDGARHTVTGTEKLTLELIPAANATIEGHRLRALTPGTATLSAKFRGLSTSLDVTVLDVDANDDTLSVYPKSLTLRVGEIADVQVVAAPNPPYRMVSSVPKQVEVSGRSRLIGRAIGGGAIQIIQGDKSVSFDVKVVAGNFTALTIDPPRISVAVDDSRPLRVLADSPDGPRAEIAPDQLQWIALPRPEIAQLDRQGPRVKGMQQTDEPEELSVKFGELHAEGLVDVTSTPLQLELSPAGTIELPVGQKLSLKTEACYGDGRRVVIPPERLEWEVDPISGLRFGSGDVEALKAGAGPLKVKAVYQGRTSNVVAISSIEPDDLKLSLQPDKSTVATGEAGQFKLIGIGSRGPVQLNMDGVTFESQSPDVVAVDRASGAFRGLSPGKAKLIAKHPLVTGSGSCELTVTDDQPGSFKPASVRLLTTAKPPIRLPVGTSFTDFRVEATNADGATRDVTADAQLSVEGDLEPAPLAIHTGRLVAQAAGRAKLKVGYDGVMAAESLDVEVIDELEIDQLVIVPQTLDIAVGESAGLRAIGWKQGRVVGDITGRPELTWKSDDAAVALADGCNITGLAEGRSHVTVEYGKIVSQASVVTVTATPSPSRRLVVTPSSLTMGLEESRHIGTDITITRDGADVSSQCLVSPAARNIVEHLPERDSLVARGAGRTRVRFSLGSESVMLDVSVEPRPRATSGNVRLVVEPAKLNLAVGEEASLRVFRVSENGQRADVTDAALLSSSADTVVAVSGRGVLGMTAGEADILVRVSGIDAPATVKAVVTETPYQSLEVSPVRVPLSVGERRKLTITGITNSGRKRLGLHPDLKLTAGGANPAAVQIEKGHNLFGAEPGAATINCVWRDNPSKLVPVRVTADPLRDLTIEPNQAVVAVGDTVDFQVFARRGNSVVELGTDDGVRLRVGNTTIATADRTLRVRGRSPGDTEVIAQAGVLRASAPLKVATTGSDGNGTASSSTAAGNAPAAKPVGLMFVPSATRVELGYPGNRIRVIRTLADGTQQDVDHLVTLTVREPQDVISITTGPAGPLITPKKIGQTQIDAELDGMKSRSPLLVDVVERLPNNALLRISPNPLVIRNGQNGAFARVEVVPAPGSSPIEMSYKLSATSNQIFRVDPDNKIRATATGQAIVAVTVVDPGGKYDGLSGSATVEVPDDVPQATARLRLTGTSETSVGAEVEFFAELFSGGSSVDVTNTETTLVLQPDQMDMADVRAGCRLIARKPGRVTLQAKHREYLSNTHSLVIRPVSSEFASLELDVEQTPLLVGESRPYKLWGHPRDGSARQDLTSFISDKAGESGVPHVALEVTLPNPGTQVAVHSAPAVIGKQPGQFTLQGRLGTLQTKTVTLDVSGSGPAAVALDAKPSTLTLRLGETSAPVQIFARSKGDRASRPVEAQWETLNASVATLEQGTPSGRITANGIGQAQVRAIYGGLSTLIDVKVVGDRFRQIGEGKLVNVGKQTFSIELTVQGDRSEGEIEYRIVCSDRESSVWTKSQPVADGVKVTLTSPALRIGPPTELYQLTIEARDSSDKSIEHYPYSFRIVPGVTRVNPQK
ncbi:MAG: hypothetical protein JSS49_23815 [Planctomycetes bacterium]|nr:hypothetical protein [Planctomycetota bacterium]